MVCYGIFWSGQLVLLITTLQIKSQFGKYYINTSVMWAGLLIEIYVKKKKLGLGFHFLLHSFQTVHIFLIKEAY